MDKLDWNMIIPALIVGFPIILTAITNLIIAMKTNKTVADTKTAVGDLAKSVDGHMSTLIEQTKTISKAEGTAEGIAKGVELAKAPVILDRRDKP